MNSMWVFLGLFVLAAGGPAVFGMILSAWLTYKFFQFIVEISKG
jgi:hypothetical protein